MIVEGESGLSQKERKGNKRNMEASERSQRPGNYQNHFGRRLEPQQSRNVGFRKPKVRSGGSGSRPQNVNQQGCNHPQIPKYRTCGKHHLRGTTLPSAGTQSKDQ